MTQRRIADKPRQYWSRVEQRLLRRLYPDTSTRALARQLGRSVSAVYGMAATFGLRKSDAYLASPDACRLRRGDNVGAGTRFQRGHTPANKGIRRPGWSAGRMAETQFRPGNRPHTWRPIGSTRVNDGYLQRKVSDTGYTPRDWICEHVLLWQERRGPIPTGHTVAFKDKDRTNIVIENLELLSRRELMARNTVHRLPKELADVIQLSGALKRKLRTLHEKQNVRSS